LRLSLMDIGGLTGLEQVSGLVAPALGPQDAAVLVVLAASLLVFRTFRERYLLIWIVGWLAYFVSRCTLHGLAGDALSTYSLAIGQAEFILAVCLFAAAVFVYAHAKDLVLPLLLIGITVLAYSVVRVLLWPDSLTLRVALEVAYRLIAFTAAMILIRFRWSRWEIGPWLLSISLVMLHLDWVPVNVHLPPGSSLILDLMFGLSMLLVVFDDSKMRTRRLGAVNALTSSITRAQQHGPMMATALEELKALMGARAAWFQLLDGNKLVMAQQIGLSPDFLRDRNSVALDENQERILREGNPAVIKTSTADEALRS
jgi:hypothetical protein